MNDAGRKKILFVGSGAPWNGGAGYLVRQNLFLGALARVAELHLAMFDSKPGVKPPAYAASFTALPPVRRTRSGRVSMLLADTVSPTPRMFRGVDNTAARDVMNTLSQSQFDAVFAYRIDFAHFAGVENHPRLILDIDDPEHLRSERRLATTSTEVDRRTRADVAKLKRFEHAAVAKAKLAFVCQQNDRLGWPANAVVEVVPNCVEVLANPVRARTRPIILFLGNCAGSAISPNVDAVIYFLTRIWPGILKAVPDAEFRLVGAASEVVKKAAAISPRTTLSGFVDDLAAVYSESAMSIAPLRFGTGTRIKILEAFSHACPVVSTLVGAEGIDAIPGREIELAGPADDFASRCIRLLGNQTDADKIGQGGYALAARLYDRDLEQDRLVARLNTFFS